MVLCSYDCVLELAKKGFTSIFLDFLLYFSWQTSITIYKFVRTVLKFDYVNGGNNNAAMFHQDSSASLDKKLEKNYAANRVV